ncbi:MAG: 4-hydroxybenzoate octaprenyltransferase [Pseudomonadota bacterium]
MSDPNQKDAPDQGDGAAPARAEKVSPDVTPPDAANDMAASGTATADPAATLPEPATSVPGAERPAGPVDGQLPRWMADNLPDWTEPYIYLARWDRPVGIWLLVLPAWIGFGFTAINAGFSPLTILWAIVFFIGAVAMRGAGCTWNDIADRKLDAEVERTAARPIPAGLVSVTQAGIWLGIQLGVAFLIWLMLPTDAKVVALVALPLIGAYPFMKRFTWWPQAWLGATFNFGVLIAAATTASVSLSTIILWLGLACWTVAYDTIYALQDREDDELAGIKSTARLFGDQAITGTFVFHLTAAALIALAAYAAGAPQIGAVTALAFLGHGVWQVARLAQDRDSAALPVFRSNVWAGGILAAGFLVAGLV